MLTSKLPNVGTTIFTTMSQLAADTGALNLSQGFPDFDGPGGVARSPYAPRHGGPQPVRPDGRLPPSCASRWRPRWPACTDDRWTSPAKSPSPWRHPGDLLCDPGGGPPRRRGDRVRSLLRQLRAVRATGRGTCIHQQLSLPDFRIDWQRLADAITPRTRMIVLNTPHNPSGALIDGGDLDRLAALIRERDIYLLSDEVYEHLVFDGREHASVLRHEELYQRAFVVSLVRQDLSRHWLEDRLRGGAGVAQQRTAQGASVRQLYRRHATAMGTG